MIASFVNAVVRAPDFRSQMKVVAERMRRGQLPMMLVGLEQGKLGKDLPATVGALERIFPHMIDQSARRAIRIVYQQFIRIRDGALKERYVHSLELNSGTNELLRVLR